jgi:hypothetical protein
MTTPKMMSSTTAAMCIQSIFSVVCQVVIVGKDTHFLTKQQAFCKKTFLCC